jgi:hypothetical protein
MIYGQNAPRATLSVQSDLVLGQVASARHFVSGAPVTPSVYFPMIRFRRSHRAAVTRVPPFAPWLLVRDSVLDEGAFTVRATRPCALVDNTDASGVSAKACGVRVAAIRRPRPAAEASDWRV